MKNVATAARLEIIAKATLPLKEIANIADAADEIRKGLYDRSSFTDFQKLKSVNEHC